MFCQAFFSSQLSVRTQSVFGYLKLKPSFLVKNIFSSTFFSWIFLLFPRLPNTFAAFFFPNLPNYRRNHGKVSAASVHLSSLHVFPIPCPSRPQSCRQRGHCLGFLVLAGSLPLVYFSQIVKAPNLFNFDYHGGLSDKNGGSFSGAFTCLSSS